MKSRLYLKDVHRMAGWGYPLAIIGADAQHLLTYQNPIGYCANIYGHKCDVYQVGDHIITMGRDPVGRTPDRSLVRDYDIQAAKILGDYNLDYTEREARVNALLDEFLNGGQLNGKV